jgi:hypothetical protein
VTGVWDRFLVCSVKKLEHDFRTKTLRLFFPANHCCDAGGAINYAKNIDPGVTVIETFAGDKLDTVYRLDGEGEWQASCYQPWQKS